MQQSKTNQQQVAIHDLSSADNVALQNPVDVNSRWLRLKIDIYILPLLASVIFLSQIGSTNIANAYEAGMGKDLSLSPKQYSNAASLFLVGFVVGSLPGTLLLKQLTPPIQFAATMVVWGLLSIGQAFAEDYASLVVYRVFIGFAEAFVQGAVFYLSFWYRYDELATRAGFLSAVLALAGAFNGLLSFAIQSRLDGYRGLSAWRWIFLIGGILPIGWSVVVLFALPSTPDKVRYGFSESEKTCLVTRASTAHNTGSNRVDPKLIPKVLVNPAFWLLALIQSGLVICATSTSYFLPAIIAGLGYEGKRAQLMTVTVYAITFVGILLVSWLSDVTRLRGVWVIACCLVTAVGYVLLLTTTSLPGGLVATCLISAGSNAPSVVAFVWMVSLTPGYTFRASALAFINVVARGLVIAGSQAFTDPPRYRHGIVLCLSLVLCVVLLSVVLLGYARYMNARKIRMQESEDAAQLRCRSVDEIGIKHPDIFFAY